jgi:hypothetical protein
VLAIAIWDLVLVGVPLAIGAILALNNWPFANIRILLAGIFLAELFFVLVPTTSSRPPQTRGGPVLECPSVSTRSQSVPRSLCW